MDNLFDIEAIDLQNIKKVTDYIDELEIYQHYEPTARLGLQSSFFRVDKDASFSIYERDGKVLWKDHGGNGDRGNVYDFVRLWYKKTELIDLSFPDVNRAIAQDMRLSSRQTMNKDLFIGEDGPRIVKKATKEQTLIQVVDEGWTNWAYAYWIERYQISPNILEAYHVGHAKQVWHTPVGKQTYLWGVSIKEDPIYYFYFPISKHVKVYRPFGPKKKKWLMNCDNNTDIQGYHQMNIKVTRPDLVIFTKAMKEIMFYRSLHIDAIAIHGENHYFTEDFIRHIKKYSKHQLFILDNDAPGLVAAAKMSEECKIPWQTIKEAKNITDLWEKKPWLVDKYLTALKSFK